jgi:hypothetical protein
VSAFEQSKVIPPILPASGQHKRTSFPPTPYLKENETLINSPQQIPTEAVSQPSPTGDWTMVTSPTNATSAQSIACDDIPSIITSIPQLQSTATLAASVDAPDLEVSPAFDTVTAECVPITRTTSFAAAERPTLAQQDFPVPAQQTAAQIPSLTTAGTITAPPAPAGARYTFEDVDRITTFAKEELQRRAAAEVAALTTQLASKTSEAQTLRDENAVLKDTLLQ